MELNISKSKNLFGSVAIFLVGEGREKMPEHGKVLPGWRVVNGALAARYE
jgi:hypothetical protein